MDNSQSIGSLLFVLFLCVKFNNFAIKFSNAVIGLQSGKFINNNNI